MKTKSFFLLVAVSLFMLACKKDEPEETKPAETSNKAPTVTLTSPTTGGAGAAPQTETLSATASDEDGTITKVEFYVGTTLVG
nr:Ig-like domain-containing protein [Cytophagaceae bacterium]